MNFKNGDIFELELNFDTLTHDKLKEIKDKLEKNNYKLFVENLNLEVPLASSLEFNKSLDFEKSIFIKKLYEVNPKNKRIKLLDVTARKRKIGL